jgi:hypothetical protein
MHKNYFHLRLVSINSAYMCMYLGRGTRVSVRVCVYECWRRAHMQIYAGVIEFRVDKRCSDTMTLRINKNIFYMSEKHCPLILILTLVRTPNKYIIRRNMLEDTSIEWNIYLLSKFQICPFRFRIVTSYTNVVFVVLFLHIQYRKTKHMWIRKQNTPEYANKTHVNTKSKHTWIRKENKREYRNKTQLNTKLKHTWIRKQNTREYENKTHMNIKTKHTLIRKQNTHEYDNKTHMKTKTKHIWQITNCTQITPSWSVKCLFITRKIKNTLQTGKKKK